MRPPGTSIGPFINFAPFCVAFAVAPSRLAGAWLRRGMRYGVSEEFGSQPAEYFATVYDVHTTLLHLLGIDHTRLTIYHNGIQRLLTDVLGQIVREILA